MHPLSNIIVKEHRAMISERSNQQKKYLKKLKYNSIFYIGETVISNNENSPLKMISNSKGIIVQSGTTGLEGLLFNKPTLIFGKPIYSKFIPKSINPDDPDELFNFFINPKKFITPREKIEKYIAVVMKYGFKLDISKIEDGTLSSKKISDLAQFLVS